MVRPALTGHSANGRVGDITTQRWIIGLLGLALIVYAGRAAVLGFERAVQDNERAKAEMAEHIGKQRAAEAVRAIAAGEAARAEQLQRATAAARR